jgi:hypothetical protein
VHGGYDDSPEVYWELLQAFRDNLDNFCAESAHLMFWFSMDNYNGDLCDSIAALQDEPKASDLG